MVNVSSYFQTVIIKLKLNYMVIKILSMMKRNTHFQVIPQQKPNFPED